MVSFISVWIAITAFASCSLADKVYKYVAAFSVDGLHGSDVGKYLAVRPNSNIAQLLNTGIEYTNALTSAPSDSFPGTLAQYTGASPRTHGVWYDAIWDRSVFDVGSNCTGPPGAMVVMDESIDFDLTKLFSGGIDPANLPKTLRGGKCVPIFPHERLRVNTVFEVLRSKGKETAYADKHPAYDLVRGPSGNGLSTGYFPEIASLPNTVDAVIGYDQMHVDAFLDWLDAKTPANSEGMLTTIPTLFGGNFQCINVAQKTVGYSNASGNPFSPPFLKAMDFVDASLGKVVAKLKAKNILEDTLIIVASKHGQTPIDPLKFMKIDPDAVMNATGVPVLSQTSDDVALIFLKSQTDTEKAVDALQAQRKALEIFDIIAGEELQDLGLGDPLKDPAVPDIVVRPELGIVYTTSTKKIAEHGGFGPEDRGVACFVSNPQISKMTVSRQVHTKQVAPTMLKALGFNPGELQGVVAEGTLVLPGF